MRNETLHSKTSMMYRDIMQGHTINLNDERQNAEYMLNHICLLSDKLFVLRKENLYGNSDVLMRQIAFGNTFHRYMGHIDNEEYIDLHEQLETFFEHPYRMEYRIDEWQGEYILRGVYMDVYGHEQDYREEMHDVHLYTFAVKKEAEWIKHIMELTDEKLDYINKPF